MPVCNVASDWPRTFLHPRCFCLASRHTEAIIIVNIEVNTLMTSHMHLLCFKGLYNYRQNIKAYYACHSLKYIHAGRLILLMH